MENTKGSLLDSFSKTDFNLAFIGIFTLTIFLSILNQLNKAYPVVLFVCRLSLDNLIRGFFFCCKNKVEKTNIIPNFIWSKSIFINNLKGLS